MTNRDEITRLSQLIQIGYRIYRGEIAVPPPPPAPPKPPLKGCFANVYLEGLKREIEENYSTPPGAHEYLISQIRKGSIKGFSKDDCAAALRILDSFLRDALFIESRYGDCPEAVNELKALYPGLPGNLYSDLIGYYGYINR